jgi:hypothetical protein
VPSPATHLVRAPGGGPSAQMRRMRTACASSSCSGRRPVPDLVQEEERHYGATTSLAADGGGGGPSVGGRRGAPPRGGRRPVELPTADRVATASQSFSREGARSWDVWAHADGVDGGLRENEGRSPDATAGQKCHPSPPGDGWCPRCGWSKSIPVSASFNPFRDIM